jgi:hypothetical protein
VAEILIKAVDATHADPDKDRRGCYKRGMPVVVAPDGHTWGAEERLPRFVVLKLPGIGVERVQQFIEHQTEGVNADGSPILYRRRLWKLFVNEIPVAVRNKIEAQGYITIGPGGDFTWAQARNYIRNLRTNALAPSAL